MAENEMKDLSCGAKYWVPGAVCDIETVVADCATGSLSIMSRLYKLLNNYDCNKAAEFLAIKFDNPDFESFSRYVLNNPDDVVTKKFKNIMSVLQEVVSPDGGIYVNNIEKLEKLSWLDDKTYYNLLSEILKTYFYKCLYAKNNSYEFISNYFNKCTPDRCPKGLRFLVTNIANNKNASFKDVFCAACLTRDTNYIYDCVKKCKTQIMQLATVPMIERDSRFDNMLDSVFECADYVVEAYKQDNKIKLYSKIFENLKSYKNCLIPEIVQQAEDSLYDFVVQVVDKGKEKESDLERYNEVYEYRIKERDKEIERLSAAIKNKDTEIKKKDTELAEVKMFKDAVINRYKYEKNHKLKALVKKLIEFIRY